MHSVTLFVSCLLIITSTAKPATDQPVTTTASVNSSCSSEGSSCAAEGDSCCDGLTCLVSGDDRVRRCFELLPSVEYDEVTCMDKKLPFYGEKEIMQSPMLKGCCSSEEAWKKESKTDCCLLSGSVYLNKTPIPCCRRQLAIDRNGTLICPPESGNPLDEDVVDLP